MDVENFITSLGQKSFHFLANEGNAGDGLIHCGFHQLADRLGLQLETFHYPEDRRGKHLLVMGAGAFCAASWHKVDAVQYYSSRFENVYLLPSTFEATFPPIEKMLRELPANVTVFCRERVSYDAVLKMVPRAEKVFLDHDLAFHVDYTPWKTPGQGELNAFRTDKESLLNRVPSPNYDISNMGREYHHTLIVDIVSNFESINTDRLHVAIAGANLGKKVRVFSGNYHKIKSIYDYSIRDKFPNVTMCSTDELKALLTSNDQSAFRSKLFRLALRLPRAQYFLRELKRYRIRQTHK